MERTERGGRPVVRMSVRAVVETTLHESDLTPASGAAKRMLEGAAAHRARQSGLAKSAAGYRAEAPLSAVYETPRLTLRVSGRADGLLVAEDGARVVEEIKLGGELCPLVPAHEAQAEMYGHMLCQSEGLSHARLRVVYVSGEGEPLRVYETERSAGELARRFEALCAAAAAWEEKKLARRRARDATLACLAFPYPQYRRGQRRFAQNVYVAIRERKRLFAQAATGAGKTVAALYPALRALGEGLCARVLFLTARTTGRLAALDAMARLTRAQDAGNGETAPVLTVELTAKDKICPRERRDCLACPLAAGFFDRLPEALGEALDHPALLDAARVRETAQRYALCPFELSLALAQLADVVVCDYNYVFDPFAAVDALLPGAALLVDEAHQLAPRALDARSVTVSAGGLRALRRETGRAHGRSAPLYRALTGALRALEAVAQAPAETDAQNAQAGPMDGARRLDTPPEALGQAMQAVLDAAAAQLAQGGGPSVLEAFSLAATYGLAASRFDERYAALTGGGAKDARLSLLCLDASPELLALTRRAHGTAYFSATLAPLDAAMRMLGGEEGDARLSLPSPFDPAQLNARVEAIDLRYAAREANAPRVAERIARHLQEHAGNALVFFPSYAYRDRVGALLEAEGCPGVRLLSEQRGMDEAGRRALLDAFSGGEERVALLAVLGGAFGEGIDLPGAKLSSVIVVSTGLPQPDERARAMRAYYDAQGEDGFFLTMTLPGMVRVLQAAGRLIRTDEDVGDVLLIDARYLRGRERALLAGTLLGDALGIGC